MTRPLWLEIHNGMIDDIRVVMQDIAMYEKWIAESDYTSLLHSEYIECLGICKNKLTALRKEYKLRYGRYPSRKQLK